MNRDQAITIINQLGGNKFKAMTGAKDFTFGSIGLTFKIGRNAHRINYVRINLEPTDLYTVDFLRISKKNTTVVSKHEQIYCDQLQELFTKETGMLVSLF